MGELGFGGAIRTGWRSLQVSRLARVKVCRIGKQAAGLSEYEG
jgi:hypothetical protein